MRMKSGMKGLIQVLVLGRVVSGHLPGAVNLGQQTHRRRQGPGMWVLGPLCKSRLRGLQRLSWKGQWLQ